MMPEIVRFWASIAQSNAERQRYEIHGVMGPDQFHEKSQSLSRRGDHADVRRYPLPRFTDSVGVHGTGGRR